MVEPFELKSVESECGGGNQKHRIKETIRVKSVKSDGTWRLDN